MITHNTFALMEDPPSWFSSNTARLVLLSKLMHHLEALCLVPGNRGAHQTASISFVVII